MEKAYHSDSIRMKIIVSLIHMKKKHAIMLLLLTSLIWGLAFVAQSAAADDIGSFTFNGIRFLIGAMVLLPIAVKSLRKSISDHQYLRNLLIGSLVCGVFLSAASMLQQQGIKEGTGSGKAGFITSLYMLFVPLLSMLNGKRISRRTWLCILAGVLGAYLLSADESGKAAIKGDMLVLASALLFAMHILSVERFGRKLNGIELSCGQYAIAGIICSAGMILFEPPDISSILSAWTGILYAGIFSCGVAYTLQVIAQKHVDAAPATLALSLESVWALIGGALILGERMSAEEITGCIILFCAVVISQLSSESDGS